MRFLVAVVVLMAGCWRSECEEPELLCHELANACGNNEIDTCSRSFKEGCGYFEAEQEPCDGTLVPSCSTLGYYDGASTCADCQRVDTTACRACASGATACASYPLGEILELVASGTHVLGLGSLNGAALFDGTTLVHQLDEPLSAAVAVPDGWLVWSGTSVAPLAFDGTLGAVQSIPGLAGLASDGTRVLFVRKDAGTVVAAVADTTGTLLTPYAPLFADANLRVSVISVGSQFIVGQGDKLARVAVDNTLLGVASGVPRAPMIWDGIALWYVDGEQVQPYSVTGTPIGAPRTAPAWYATAGAGKLLVLTFEGSELVVRGFSSKTTEVTRTVLGIGAMAGTIVQVGDQILGVWYVRETHVALVPAP